jgi:hypothetical protein
MSDTQIFQLFGLGFLAIGLGMLINGTMVKRVLRDLEHTAAAIYLSGLVSMVVGFLIVTFHNVWVWGWPVIITFIGWSALLKGLSILAYPQFSLGLSERIAANKHSLKLFAWSSIALGLLSLYLGYSA